MNQRVIHDVAMAMAQAILDKIKPRLRENEGLHALFDCYIVCKAGIETYEIQNNRMQRRLNPLQN